MASECVVVTFDANTQKLLDYSIVARKLKSDNLGNFDGASACMEAVSLWRICQRLKNYDLQVDYVIHDRDGSTLSIVQEFFPYVVEYNDKGHAVNNFRKQLAKLAKTFPELTKMATVSFAWNFWHSMFFFLGYYQGSYLCFDTLQMWQKEFARLLRKQYQHK